MKKILFIQFICILYSGGLFAQSDSSKQRVSGIIVKGKDSDGIANIIKGSPNEYPILDSVIKQVYTATVNDNDNITLNSIPNKEWLRMIRKLRADPDWLIAKTYDRVHDTLFLRAGSWVISRIIVDDNKQTATIDNRKKDGQKYGKKQDDEPVN